MRDALCIHHYEACRWDYSPYATCGGRPWNGYEGGMQFVHSTWTGAGGRVFAEHAWEATPRQQIIVSYWLWERYGWSPWPNSSRSCGL